VATKRCSKCGQAKPISAFNRDRWKSDGLKSQCKACRNLAKRRYRARLRHDSQRRLKRAARYAWVSHTSIRPRLPARYHGEGFRRWRESLAARRQARRQTARRKWFARHPLDGWRWRQENPARITAQQQARRAGAIGAPLNDLSEDQWAWLLDAYGHRCAYCGAPGVALSPDHVVPLARGGSNTLSNVVPACRECNSRKQARTPDEAGMIFAVHINLMERMVQQALIR